MGNSNLLALGLLLHNFHNSIRVATSAECYIPRVRQNTILSLSSLTRLLAVVCVSICHHNCRADLLTRSYCKGF